MLASGKAEYTAKCFACHGDKGQGLIGPNMTDDYWIHGDSTVTAILKTARSGVPGKGMLPWKDVIPEETLEAVAAYNLQA